VPFYESVFIARQDASPAQVDSLVESIEKVITGLGGSVPKKESWGLRSLAYKIKKNRKGYYVLLNIDAPPAAITEMERQMRINEDVIRYLTTRVEALEEGPSAVMRNKDRGDDRGGRRGGRDDHRRFRDGPRDRGRDGGRDDRRPRDHRPPPPTADAKPADAKAGDGGKDKDKDKDKAESKDKGGDE